MQGMISIQGVRGRSKNCSLDYWECVILAKQKENRIGLKLKQRRGTIYRTLEYNFTYVISQIERNRSLASTNLIVQPNSHCIITATPEPKI